MTDKIPQRQLAPLLRRLIDDAQAPNSTAHRDIARSELRRILENQPDTVRTSFIGVNLSPRRVRYLASIGFWMPMRWMSKPWSKPNEIPEQEE